MHTVIQYIYNYFVSPLIKGKTCCYLPGDIGGEGKMKKVTHGDIEGKGV